ncbi:30S ribosomal protein S6 [Candidatus Falkowbacteria bacterium]|nr:MAG: 30S ribosomal protein S6 [Candidatus Falkowbacteria bacterium]
MYFKHVVPEKPELKVFSKNPGFFPFFKRKKENIWGFFNFNNFMAKNKKNEIPHYELLYIVSNKYTEDELKPIVLNVNKTIEENGGKITYKEDWGKKKLAYSIKHFNYGYYSLAEFDIEGGQVEKIDKELRMSSEILRHTIVVKIAKTAEEIKAEKTRAKVIVKKAIKEKRKEKEEPLKKEEPKTKVDLKDLDEKLDKILDTDDLL